MTRLVDEGRGEPRDVRFVPVGVGMSSTFRCAACCRNKPIFGRRLKRVLGLRQYVCAGCFK